MVRQTESLNHMGCTKFCMTHVQRFPVSSQRSEPRFQYWYCAERILFRRSKVPVRVCWFREIRSFMKRQARSMIWVPAFTLSGVIPSYNIYTTCSMCHVLLSHGTPHASTAYTEASPQSSKARAPHTALVLAGRVCSCAMSLWKMHQVVLMS